MSEATVEVMREGRPVVLCPCCRRYHEEARPGVIAAHAIPQSPRIQCRGSGCRWEAVELPRVEVR